IRGKRAYFADMGALGPVRADEFLLPPFDVTIATSAQSMRDSLREFAKISIALLAVMLAASIVIGLALSRLIVRPVRLLRATASPIGSDNLGERIAVSEVKDEISDLARLLNQTFDRLESAFTQIRRFADEASHELKTPLSLIRLHAERMLNDGDLA